VHSELWHYLQTRTPTDLGRDLLDVLITYYIFYRVALVLRGTRAMQMVAGLALVFVLYIFAELMRLGTVLTLLSAVLSSAILIGVVVFQNDIRRGLMRMGARAQLGSGQTLEGKLIDDVVEAATILARHRTGAIMTFEQEANLDEFVGSHTGHVIDAAVTPELLVSLFIPEALNKLHDGAVIIRDLRIAKAGVFFPMPEGRVADASFGSRHRAAMGITEETDAVVVVVSEERGTISFCFNGNIIANLDGPRLRAALEGVFASKAPATSRHRPTSWLQRLLQRRTGSVETVVTAPASVRPPPASTAVSAPSSKRKKPPSDVPAPLRKKKATQKQPVLSEDLSSEPLRPSRPPVAIGALTQSGSDLQSPPRAEPQRATERLEEPRSDDGRHTLLTGELAPVRLPASPPLPTFGLGSSTTTPLPGPPQKLPPQINTSATQSSSSDAPHVSTSPTLQTNAATGEVQSLHSFLTSDATPLPGGAPK
jgi:diadenylate cyclase